MGVMSNYIPESMGRSKKRSIIALWDVQDTEVATIPAGERPQTYALDRAATGTGKWFICRRPNCRLLYIIQQFLRTFLLQRPLRYPSPRLPNGLLLV